MINGKTISNTISMRVNINKIKKKNKFLGNLKTSQKLQCQEHLIIIGIIYKLTI